MSTMQREDEHFVLALLLPLCAVLCMYVWVSVSLVAKWFSNICYGSIDKWIYLRSSKVFILYFYFMSSVAFAVLSSFLLSFRSFTLSTAFLFSFFSHFCWILFSVILDILLYTSAPQISFVIFDRINTRKYCTLIVILCYPRIPLLLLFLCLCRLYTITPHPLLLLSLCRVLVLYLLRKIQCFSIFVCFASCAKALYFNFSFIVFAVILHSIFTFADFIPNTIITIGFLVFHNVPPRSLFCAWGRSSFVHLNMEIYPIFQFACDCSILGIFLFA